MRSDAEKRKRQELIKEIIRSKPIATQEELATEIRNRNLIVTQTTVSRDLEELQVGKWNGKYHVPYAAGDMPAWFETVRQHLIQTKRIGDHLIVLQTRPGTASMVEKTFNDLSMPEVAGIVSSQNTVMIAFETTDEQKKFFELVQKAVS